MLVFFRGLSSCRMFCTVSPREGTTLHFRYKVRPRISRHAALLQTICESSYSQAQEVLKNQPQLLRLDINRIRDAGEVLHKFQIEGGEIRKCPRILLILPITLEHHSRLLKESGISKLSASSIVNYLNVVTKKISLLKIHGLLSQDANVSRNFLNVLDAPADVVQTVESVIGVKSDENNISTLRDTVLKCYLQWRLDASREEVEYIFSTYARLLHKSLQLIQRTISIYLNELHFPKGHIIKNGFLIQAHPDHLRKIIDNVPHLAGKPIRDILYARPSIAIASYENFIEILNVLRKAGISEKSIVHNQTIFHLSEQCVKKRLPALRPNKMAPEVKAAMVEDKLLPVLLNYENFKHRLTYLSDQNSSISQAPSIHLLVSTEKNFERFVKGVYGPIQGNDIVNYLVESFSKIAIHLSVTSTDIRSLLKKNLNWRFAPLSEVKKCLQMLLKQGYKPKEILLSIPIVLYPSNIVEGHLKHLSSKPEVLENLQFFGLLENDLQSKNRDKNIKSSVCIDLSSKKTKDLIRKYALPLCLYFLEKDHHFSGDGIWFQQ